MKHSTIERLETRRLLAAATNIFNLTSTLDDSEHVVAGDAIYFIHNDDIYRSFGTAATTTLVYAGQSPSSTFKDLTVAPNGNIYFIEQNKLYRLSPSTSSAVLLADLDVNSPTGDNPRGLRENIVGIHVADDFIYLFADAVSAPGGVVALYFSQGLANDAEFVADNLPKFNVGNSRAHLGTTLVYAAEDDTLRRSDGTPSGTFQLGDELDEGDGFHILAANGFVYFSADDDQGSPTDHGFWTTNGTLAGTLLLDAATEIDLVDGVVGNNGQVYFPVANGLYTSDGTVPNSGVAPGTNVITNTPSFLASVGNSIYFSATTSLAAYQAINRLDLATNTVKKITNNTSGYTLATDAGNLGTSTLTSYIFTGEITSDSQRLYVTNPITDDIDLVTNVPDGIANARFGKPFATSVGAFFVGGTNDLYFTDVPFSILDSATTILYVEATSFSDQMTASIDGSEIVLTLFGKEERHTLNEVNRMEVQLGEGDDVFTATTTFPVNSYIFGDTGDDTCTGGAGRDTLTGAAGRNRLFGGPGDDKLNGSNGRDFLRGDDGDDRLYGRGGDDDLAGGGNVDRLFGDEITGPQGNDFLKGGSSNDKLYGRGGNDTLVGEKHSDLMFGGDGNDVLAGSDGDDTLDGQAGNDNLFGELGNDTFIANDSAADTLDGGDGSDTADIDASGDLVSNIETLT